MIIYFTGTGNSRYVACALAERLEDVAVNALSDIKAGKKGSYVSEKPYLFVFPVYLSTVPTVFRDHLRRSTFTGNRDAYFVATCAANEGSAPNAGKALCGEIGLNYRGCQKVVMPQSYIALFSMDDAEKRKRRYAEAEPVLDAIAGRVRGGEPLGGRLAGGFEYWGTRLVEKWYNHSFAKTRRFRVTNACVGCGLCEKQCPANAILLKDGHPTWVKKTCVHCMSCINRCPKKAIEYGKGTATKPRYVCPPYKPHS